MAGPGESEINLSLYLHQIISGQGVNQKESVRPSSSTQFGTLVAIDWAVLDGPKPDATIVARTKGMQVHADVRNGSAWFNYFSMVFQNARYNGSSLVAMGINADAEGVEGQMAIIGGTGEFAMARGIIKYKSLGMSSPAHRVKELNIHAFYAKPAPTSSGAANE